MTTPLTTERVAWLLENGAFHDEDAADLAQIYNTANTRANRAAHWLKEYARAKNEGYSVGDLHVFSQRQVFRQVPNPVYEASVIDDLPQHERIAEIQRLIQLQRVDHRMSRLRKSDLWSSVQRACDAAEDGYLEVRGEPSLDIRSKPPAEAYCEVVPPRGEPDPETPAGPLPDTPAEEYAEMGPLSPGD